MRRDKQDEKEKARLLVAALLFKIGSSQTLKTASRASLKELMQKIESIIEKYSIEKDESLMNTIEKMRSVIGLKDDDSEKLLDDYSLQYPDTPVRSKSNQKKILISKPKTENQVDTRSSSKPKGFVIRGSSKSPQIVPRGKTPETRSRAAKSTNQSPKVLRKHTDVSAHHSIRSPPLRMSTGKSIAESSVINIRQSYSPEDRTLPSIKELREKAAQARRDFKEGIDHLLKIGEFVKKEIQELNEEPRLTIIKIKKKPIDGGDDSEDEKSDTLDKEISTKIGLLYDQQIEWEKQRAIFQEKLEKLEKNLERQTAADENASHLMLKSPKNSIGFSSPHDQTKGKGSFLTPKQNPNSKPTIDKNKKADKPLSDSNKTPKYSGKASMGSELSLFSSQLSNDSYTNTLKFVLQQFESGIAEFDQEFRQIVSCGKDTYVIIGFKAVRSPDPKGKPMVILSLYSTKSDIMDYSTPLNLNLKQQDYLTLEELEFIFLNMKASEVIPSQCPITALSDIKYFLVKILGKFVHLGGGTSASDAFTIRKIPRSIIADQEISTDFFGEKHNFTLLSMGEKTFRMTLRPAKHAEDGEAFCADLIFNEFVLDTFFEVCSRQYFRFQRLFEEGYIPTDSEIKRMKEGADTSIRCVWLQSEAEKNVIMTYQGQGDINSDVCSQVVRVTLERKRSLPREFGRKKLPFSSEASGLEARSVYSI